MKFALLSELDSENGRETICRLLSSCSKSSLLGAYIGSQPDPDRYYYGQVADVYKSIGFEINHYLDFEDGYSEDEFETALSYPFIHLSGGNTFRFLKSLKTRGAGSRLRSYVQNGGMIIGVSAGAMLLTPNIESAFICGDENDVGLLDLQGLSLVPFMFDPHSNKKTKNVDSLKSQLDVLMASDDDALLVVDGNWHFVGAPVLFKRATV